MRSLLYGELTPWYHLLDPVEEHREEAEAFTAAFAGAVDGKLETLLELGAAGGGEAREKVAGVALHGAAEVAGFYGDQEEVAIGLDG